MALDLRTAAGGFQAFSLTVRLEGSQATVQARLVPVDQPAHGEYRLEVVDEDDQWVDGIYEVDDIEEGLARAAIIAYDRWAQVSA